MPGAIAETKPYLAGLDDFYRREIEPWLKSREVERAAAIRRRWQIIGGGLAGGAILAIALWLAQLHPLWLLLPAAIAIVAAIVGGLATARLSREVKAYLAGKLAAFFGFTYQAEPTDDPTSRFYELGLIKSDDRFELSSMGDTLVDPERVRLMAGDIGIVFDVIDCLDLRPSTQTEGGPA